MKASTRLKLFEEYHRSVYKRVIPRDFFNEAKLMKCMGVLALRILDNELPDGVDIKIKRSGRPFAVEFISDGSLTVSNYPVTINGESVTMKTTYNSKQNFPLVCEIDYEEFTVFDDSGDWDDEFVEKFASLEGSDVEDGRYVESYDVIPRKREIPPDFFNDAKLLKCMGVLALKILDYKLPEGLDIVIKESGQPFKIDMLSDSTLTVSNYPVKVNGQKVTMKSTYNSKLNFPLLCEIDYADYVVFDETGQFDPEFLARFIN